MNRLDLAELRARAPEQCAAAAATPGVCPLCSGAAWQLAAHDRLHAGAPAGRRLLAERDGAWLALAERRETGIFVPLESAWIFGSPLVGPPEAALDLFLDAVRSERVGSGRPTGAVLGGLARGGALHRAAIDALAGRGGGLREFEGTGAMLIDLGEGVDPWLARRSRKFRRSLRACKSPPPDIHLEDASLGEPEELFRRILDLQRRSYKWREGTDIFLLPEYAAFYRDLLFSLREAGALRLLFAVRDGLDLAHIFGAVVADRYRGLQMTYALEAGSLGLGNWLQLESLRRRSAEGVALYDLGMPAPYKERWADRLEERLGLFWIP
jgi:hypothetical protein